MPSLRTRTLVRLSLRRTRRRLSLRTLLPMLRPLRLRPRTRPSHTSSTLLSSPRRSLPFPRTSARPTRAALPSSPRARRFPATRARTSSLDPEASRSAPASARRRTSSSSMATVCSSPLPVRTSADAAVAVVDVARDVEAVAVNSVAAVAERVVVRDAVAVAPVVVPSPAPTSTTPALSPAWAHKLRPKVNYGVTPAAMPIDGLNDCYLNTVNANDEWKRSQLAVKVK